MTLSSTMSDLDLLRKYLAGSQEAFTELVHRHANLVYSAALRQVRDPHLAEEVAAAVFLLVWKKAGSFGPGTVLPAWLHQATRYCAANARRIRENRDRHEIRVAQMPRPNIVTSPLAAAEDSELSSIIDKSIAKLSGKDRKAVILRFLSGDSHEKVGAALGLSTEAARKRVDRALAKLRGILLRDGVNTAIPVLGEFLAIRGIKQSPPHMVSSIAAAVSAGSATPLTITAIAKGAIKMIFWNKVRISVLAISCSMFLAAGTTAIIALQTGTQSAPAMNPSPSGFAGNEASDQSYPPVFNSDHTRMAYAIRNNDQWTAVVDGKEAAGYEAIKGITFSLVGNRLAYAARNQAGWLVVLDGQNGSRYDDILSPIFSPDGKHVAYAAKLRGRWRIVFDGEDGPDFEGDILSPVFSPDSQHIAYAARKNGVWRMVLDGKDGSAYEDDIRPPVFSPDSKRFAYVASTGGAASTTTREWRAVIDGKEGAVYEDDIKPPVFSPDSKHVAYAGMTGKEWRIVIDNQQSAAFDDIRLPIFSSDSQRVAYVGISGGKWQIIVDGKESPEYDDIRLPIFSADGKHFAYAGAPGRGWRAVVDGQESVAFQSIQSPVFSWDGHHVAYAAENNGKWRVVKDGRNGPTYQGIHSVSLSVNGERLAYAARKNGKWRIVIDGQEGAVYDEIQSLIYSADGQHIAYTAREGRNWRVVKDNDEGNEEYQQVTPPAFTPDSRRLMFADYTNGRWNLHSRQVHPNGDENPNGENGM
jgi:RNA polymerase sigma factor (sigma-70 family)